MINGKLHLSDDLLIISLFSIELGVVIVKTLIDKQTKDKAFFGHM